MARRSYNQYCSVACALDIVGDRWTLLLIRELMIGPRRYTDLMAGMPGIGTNHLAERLKRLTADGVIQQRELPPPAASIVYELTPSGRGLEPVVVGLAQWGVDRLGKPEADLAWRADWTVVALRGRFDEAAAQGIDEAYQFVVDEQPFWARVRNGELHTGLDHVPSPAVTVHATRTAFLGVAAGEVTLEQAVSSGDYRIDGDPEALRRATLIFPSSSPTPGEKR